MPQREALALVVALHTAMLVLRLVATFAVLDHHRLRQLRRCADGSGRLLHGDASERARLLEVQLERVEVHLLRELERHASLRAPRAGEAGLHGAEIELEGVGEYRVGGLVGTEEPL